MSTYVVGDVQGCYRELMQLLEHIRFDPAGDVLWFVGDLVNRGPESLAVLRFVHGLGERAITVLGNHDLHLLALAYGERQPRRNDTVGDVLHADDRDVLLRWLRSLPLLHIGDSLEEGGTRPVVMTHAGVPHIWSVEQARDVAVEVEEALRSDDTVVEFLRAMYGNSPDCWHGDLEGMTRLRVITNYFTRMRAIDRHGRLNLTFDGPAAETPAPYRPWFAYERVCEPAHDFVFGHWAAIDGHADAPHVHALDTGCVWGRSLTALRLQDWTRFCISSSEKKTATSAKAASKR
jgi:bis(5'-nucleosyl)-tetraphosphatase (symmetrical)